MSINLAKEDVNIGQVVYQWKVNEYEKADRDHRWYIFMVVLGLALLVFGLFSGNYLFVLIVVLFGIIMFLHGAQEPIEVNFAITPNGIVLGNKFYRYSEIESFWLIYNPPAVKTLYFSFDKVLKHRLQVPLLDNDPLKIRKYLSQFVTEDLEQEEEPLSDRMTRLFKL